MENKDAKEDSSYFKVAEGIWGLKDIFVNVYFIAIPENNGWVLVDAGLKTSYTKIKDVAGQLFGEGVAPAGIVLTHGHFDHVGALTKLLEDWNVPVYAHHLETPYLTGRSAYPPSDSTVGGGLMAFMADLYPNEPIDLSGIVKSLPFTHLIPVLSEWEYIHTPGHAPGHISLWRAKDKVLIVGDAFVTTKQESAFSVMTQAKIISGPPKYFTYDWDKARESVQTLAALQPEIVASGHGKPMSGSEMQKELTELADHFEEKAVPKHGRYVEEPAIVNKYGVVSVPEKKSDRFSTIAVICGVAAAAALGFALISNKKYKRRRLSFK